MRLKRLELLGFKSFADKTRLEFDAGITAVVGPNGCGKSNIADAFRWVMGEQSAKSMRGIKMPDVIFAGTTNRKPLNFAEVTITLTDIAGHLPIDYEEIAITRRLHRSGESEYFINRHPVRLKDVQSLFLDTGLGKDAYSNFEQGEIDRVINLPPLERRYIFEEAAGILRFLQRKKEALKKLEQTEQNVARVKDIHQEVEKRIIVLEEQAVQARLFQENKRQLESLEKTFLIIKWEVLQTKSKEANQKVSTQDNNISGSNKQIELLQIQLKEARQELCEAEKALEHHREEVFKMRSAKEVKSKEKQNHEERLKDLIEKEKRWHGELKAMEESFKLRETERKRIGKIQQELEKKYVELEKALSKQRDKLKGLDERLLEQRNQNQIKQKEWMQLVQIENQCNSQMHQANVRLENVKERQKQLQNRKKQIEEEIETLNFQNVEKNHLLEESTRALDSQKSLFTSMDAELKSISLEMESTQESIDRLFQEISESNARQKALQRLRSDMEGFSEGAKQLLQESSSPKSPLFKKIKGLFEFFVPQKGSEALLAAAMRPYSQTLAVKAEEDFLEVIEYIKKNKIKDVSLVCFDTILKLQSSKSILQQNDELTPLELVVLENELVHHFLKHVFVAKKGISLVDIINENTGFEICLADGSYLDRKCVLYFAGSGENNVFLREAELKALEKKIVGHEEEKLQLDSIFRAMQQKRQQLHNDRSELDKAIRRAEMRLVEINFAIKKHQGDIDRLQQEEKIVTNDLQVSTKAITEISNSLEQLNKTYAAAKKASLNAQTISEKLHADLDHMISETKKEESVLREGESNAYNTKEEIRKNAHALNVLDIKDTETEQQAKRMQEEIELTRSLQSQIERKGKEVSLHLQTVEHSLGDVVSRCSAFEKEVSTRKNALDQMENKIIDQRHILKKYENERNHLGIQYAQLESQQQSLENELKEKFNLAIQKAKEEFLVTGQTLDQIERHMRTLRQHIESSGNVNMTAIDECENHKSRYQFLNQQIDDLNVSKQELVEIITQLDDESRKIFLDTFEKISLNFKKNFQILFNGGEADLQFTESSDILEAGIDIIAKPPGKQMRSINLLSGGEKCLTAMALLFAIFEVRPSPFCILDEIDAPLDDTNVERFANIVKQFVDRCQFIIITHNKRTMSIADILFGVSMEERGVSKLLCMDFAKQEALV